MASDGWVLARLNQEQLRALGEAEQALGVDYLLAFEPGGGAGQRDAASAAAGLPPSNLSDDQLQGLRDLERRMQKVVVAYRKY